MVLRTLKRPYLTKINVQTDNNSGVDETSPPVCSLLIACLIKCKVVTKDKNISVLIIQLE